ncbi:MAG: O-antigen ligase family protein [Candidatus Nanopelagicales bacterium]
MTMSSALLAVLTGLGLAGFAYALVNRPQRGILALAALVPFNGLLLLVPHPGIVDGWKEALVLVTFLASLLSPDAVPWRQVRLPTWAAPAWALLLVAMVSAAFVPTTQAIQGLKIGFFYALVSVILLRNPFTPRDRDRLVTILMVTGVAAALYGVAQQAIGAPRLVAWGYEYEETIRAAGGYLRSFSSFNQPFGFGLFSMMVLLVCGSVALAEPRRWRNAIFLVCSPLLLAGMLLTIVRGAYLGLALGALLLAALRYRGLLLGIPLALAVLVNLPESIRITVFSSGSLGERGAGWSGISDEILSHPFGIGIGSTGSVAEKVATLQGSGATTYQPDSQYVKLLLEFGIVGVWLFVLFLVASLTAALITARHTVDPDSALALGIAASFLAAIGAAAVSTYFEIFPMDVYFWMFLGVLACIPRSGSTHSHCAPAAAGFRPISASSSPL